MKKSLLFMFFVLNVLMVSAAPISKQQAMEKARQFLSKHGRQVMGEARRAPSNGSTASSQPLYVFNASGNNGFVIVAGDDRAESILGYSESGSFDEDHIPANLRSWLEQTSEEIKALPVSPKMESATPLKVAVHTAIQPLIKTQWNQGSDTETGQIFNTLTPTINSKHCITGCVATAGAQLMYYYQYPTQPTLPVPGYTPNSTIGALEELPSIKFSWDQMKESYTSSDIGTASERAVSELMLYCGYAAQMDYGLDGSGASSIVLARGMASYFGYDPYTWKNVTRSSYSISDWDALIYAELKAGRPVIFSGNGTQGGHAFICDGYDGAGMYHFNWGWGGNYDGFFKLNATNPYKGERVYSDGTIDTGFAMSVSAIIGIQPDTGQGNPGSIDDNDTWDEPSLGGIVGKARNIQLDGMVISAMLQNPNGEAARLSLGLGELQADGTVTPIDTKYESFKNNELPSGSWWNYTFSFDLSTYNLADGTHRMVFISIANDDTEWVRCHPADVYYEVSVEEGSIVSVVQHPVVSLQATDFKCTSTRQPNYSQTMHFQLTNNGDNYKGSLYLFASATNEKGSWNDVEDIAIKSGNTKERSMTFRTGETGTYNVWLCTDYNGENVIAQTTVEIAQDLEVTRFDFTGNKYATVVQPVEITVKNDAGDYTQPLYLFASLSSDNKGNASYSIFGGIEGGTSEDFVMYFNPSEAGTYTIWVCTDASGTNAIGSTEIVINPIPDYEVTLTKVSLDIDAKPMGAAIVCVKNDTEYDYNESFMARLWIHEDNHYSFVKEITTTNYLIPAGETATISIPLSDLEADVNYNVDIYYRAKIGGNYSHLCETDFSFSKPVYQLGDVNHDGQVKVSDVMATVSFILNNRSANFDESLADMNSDGTVSVTDVMQIVKKILQ